MRRFPSFKVLVPLLCAACSVYGTDLLVDSNGSGGSGGASPNDGGGLGPGSGGDGGDGGSVKETVLICDNATPIDIMNLPFPPCPLCADAYCVPPGLLPNYIGPSASIIGDCPYDLGKCVPRSYIEGAGNLLFKSCTALGATEGRCVNKCIPAVGRQAGLDQDSCGDDELCAPCFYPTDGAPTGACTVGCDMGPTDPPYIFESCCEELGRCVPSNLVPSEQTALLDRNTCTSPDALCAPAKFVAGIDTPAICASVAGVEGRCIPACLTALSQQAGLLPIDICDPGELCAPCFDPRTGEATGACSVNGDSPNDAPTVFAPCCSDRGVCVPTSAVPQDQVESLERGSCAKSNELCAPLEFTNSSYTPPVCTSVAGAEGRCVNDCIPRVREQASLLPRATCEAGYLCAPCTDPVTGTSTGACTVNGDAPTRPPVLFDSCCGDAGKCVPTSAVPVSQRDALSRDVCSGTSDLCAPTSFIDPAFKPATCDSLVGAEGRCIPECVGAVSGQAQFLPREGCAGGEVCAPCYNPGDGSATGACAINGDTPTRGAVLFDTCCGTSGRCVPDEVVPDNFRSALRPETCSTTAGPRLCAPLSQIVGTAAGSDTCTFAGTYGLPGPGICFDPCTVPDFAFLPQEECATGSVCLPCFTLEGDPTGACDPNTPMPALQSLSGADADASR